MVSTKEWKKQKDNTPTPVKSHNHNPKSSPNLCGGCSACHQMTRNHSMDNNSMWAGVGDRGQYPNLQRPCATRFFQRHLGNSYIQNMAGGRQTLGQPAARGGVPKIQRTCSCGGACASCAGKEEELNEVQPKLRIGPVNDVYEQEADRMAEQIVRMPDSSIQSANDRSRKGINIQRISSGNSSSLESAQDIRLNQSGGRPLSSSTRKFMEPRFGIDFSHVRMHTDHNASDTASQIQARAFTYGQHIWLGEGANERDKRLMAHELTHVVQQDTDNARNQLKANIICRTVSFDECTSQEEAVVLASHNRAITMCNTAVGKLNRYDGTIPLDVRLALGTHFHSSGTGLASWIAFNLAWLIGQAESPQYECEKPQVGQRLGWAMWCVPWTDIELYPLWFAERDIDKRARTMIHEWTHRYGCNFDLGYEWERGYSGHGTLRSLINADPWAYLVYALR